MAKRFTRNIEGVEDIKKLPLDLTLQNDFVSDGKNVYVRNQDKYEKITGNSGGGNVASLYFDETATGISVLSTVNGDVSAGNDSGFYYNLQIVFDNGNRDSVFYAYDPELDRSVARKNMTVAQIKGRKIVGAQVEKVTIGDPNKYEVVAFEPFVQVDYTESNVYSPYYIKNKPLQVLNWSWNVSNFTIITLGDTTEIPARFLSFNEEWGNEHIKGLYNADIMGGITIYTMPIPEGVGFKNLAIALISEDGNTTYFEQNIYRGDLSETNVKSPYFVDGKDNYVLKSDYDALVARVTALESK